MSRVINFQEWKEKKATEKYSSINEGEDIQVLREIIRWESLDEAPVIYRELVESLSEEEIELIMLAMTEVGQDPITLEEIDAGIEWVEKAIVSYWLIALVLEKRAGFRMEGQEPRFYPIEGISDGEDSSSE